MRCNGQPPTEQRGGPGVLAFWVVLLVGCLVLWALVILGAVYAWELAT